MELTMSTRPTLPELISESAKKLYRRIDPDVDPKEQAGIASGIRSNLDQADYVRHMNDPVGLRPIAAPESHEVSTADLIHPAAKYGDRPGEKRLDSEGNEVGFKPIIKTNDHELTQKSKVLADRPAMIMPSYDEGTDFVPEDQVAKIHQGEAILPADEAAVYRAARELPVDSRKAPQGIAPIVTEPSESQRGTPQERKAVDADKKAAMGKGDAGLVDFGTALIHEKHLTAPEGLNQGTQGPAHGAEQGATLPSALQPTEGPRGAGIPQIEMNGATGTSEASAAPEMKPLGYKEKLADYDRQIQSALDEGTADGKEKADRLALAKQVFQSNNPWGSPDNHPGFAGKLAHIAAKIGNIAGDVVAPKTMELIPGTALNKAAQRAGTIKAIDTDTHLVNEREAADAKGEKTTTPREQLITAGQALQAAKATGDAAKIKAAQATYDNVLSAVTAGRADPKDATLDQQLLDAKNAYDQAERAGDQAGMAAAQRQQDNIIAAKHALAPEKGETQEQNKLNYQKTVASLAKANLKTGPEDLTKSITQGVARGVITADQAADALAYQAANPNPVTNIQVSGAEAQNRANIAKAGKYYTYVDENGKTQVATGDKVPEGAEATPVKDIEAYMREAETGNIVQQALNRIHEDVDKRPEVFDNGKARAILGNAVQDIDRASAGLLIAGTGGSIPIPAGFGAAVTTALQNHALDDKTAEALKQYITDYRSMKDKVVIMQMEAQGGKIGRGTALAFKAIADQIPNGETPDSKQARRLMDNMQQMQTDLMGRYPDERGSYKKEKPYQYGGGVTAPTGATDEVVKDGRVIGHVIVENGKKKFKAIE
jgi:hypothetical protein